MESVIGFHISEYNAFFLVSQYAGILFQTLNQFEIPNISTQSQNSSG